MKSFVKILIIFLAFKATVFAAYFAYKHFPVQLLHFEHIATEDIEFNDIFYSTRAENDRKLLARKEVVLVNTGCLAPDDNFRKSIAYLTGRIASYNPAAIGIDLYFKSKKERVSDSILASVILKSDNIIIATDKNRKEGKVFPGATEGFVNFPIAEGHGETIRRYYNFEIKGNDTLLSFGYLLAKFKDESIYRKRNLEYLRFSSVYNGYYDISSTSATPTYNNFPAVEATEIINDHDTTFFSQFFRDRIVIIGHLGRDNMFNPYDTEDRFMVPTDSSLIHKKLIMPGAVIHANAVQALLTRNHFTEIKGLANEVLTDFILFLFLIIFYTIHHRFILDKLLNLFIILLATIPILFLMGSWLMTLGLYYKTGSLFLQIAFLEEFVEISEGVEKKLEKYKARWKK